MSRKPSKKQRQNKKKKNKDTQVKRIQNLYEKGLDKKTKKFSISPNTFYFVKILLVVLTTLIYFYYSSLLFIFALLILSSYALAIFCQRRQNRSYLKQYQLTIPKYDSAIALILIAISIASALFGLQSFGGARFGRFNNTWYTNILNSIRNFGNMLTGERNILMSITRFQIGDLPDLSGFDPSSMPSRPGGGMSIPSFDNIPIEFLFSNLLSTTVSVLIFVMLTVSVLSVLYTYLRIKRINSTNEEIVLDDSIKILSINDISSILDFGIQDIE